MALSTINKIKQLVNDLLGRGGTATLRSRLVRGVAGSFILKVSSTGLTLITSIILARTMGVTEFGYFSYAIAIVGLLTVPTTLGLPNLIIRYLAAYQARSKWELMRGLLLRTNQAVLIISFVMATLTVAIIWPIKNNLPAIDPTTFLIALLLLPLEALNALRGASLRGLRYAVLGQLPEFLFRPGLFIILVLLLYFLLDSAVLGASTVISIRVVATVLAFILGAYLLLMRIPLEVKQSKPDFEIKAWVHSALPLLVVGGMQIINHRMDIVMLGIFTGPEEVGIYQVVTRGAELIPFALIAVNMVVAPEFSRLYANNEISRLQRIVTISSRAILIFSLPAALAMILFGHWILSSVFGSEFIPGATALAILSVAQLVNAGMGSVSYLLNMTGYERYSARGVAIAAIINVVLNLILIPRWGIEGAATATAVSLIAWNLLLAFWVYKKLNIYPSVLGAMGSKEG